MPSWPLSVMIISSKIRVDELDSRNSQSSLGELSDGRSQQTTAFLESKSLHRFPISEEPHVEVPYEVSLLVHKIWSLHEEPDTWQKRWDTWRLVSRVAQLR